MKNGRLKMNNEKPKATSDKIISHLEDRLFNRNWAYLMYESAVPTARKITSLDFATDQMFLTKQKNEIRRSKSMEGMSIAFIKMFSRNRVRRLFL